MGGASGWTPRDGLRRWWWAIGGVIGLVLVAIVFLATRGNDDAATGAADTIASTTSAVPQTQPAPSTTAALAGPVTLVVGEPTSVGSSGATVEIDGVVIEIPDGAVGPEPIEVTAFRAEAHPASEGERLLMPPVGLDLGGAQLLEPATIRFPVPEGGVFDQDLLFSVRWDDDRSRWATVWDDTIEVRADEIVVTTLHFSEPNVVEPDVSSWQSRLSNWAGRLLGTRVARPECDPEAIPRWVRDVNYTNDLAAELLVCTTVDGELLVLKIANNRTYSMLLTSDRSPESATQVGVTDDVYELVYQAFVPPLAESVVYLPPTSEWEVRLAQPVDITQLATILEGRMLPSSITADLARGVIDVLNIPVVDPLIEMFDLVAQCVGNEFIGIANADPLAVVRAVITCFGQFDENRFFDEIIEAAVRDGVIDESIGRTLASVAPLLRLVEAGRFANLTLDLLVDAFVLDGDPTIGVFARRQALVCRQIEGLPIPDEIGSDGLVLVYDFYDDGTNAADIVLRVDGAPNGLFYEGGSVVGEFPLDDDYIAQEWGDRGAYVAYVVAEGEITFCGNPDNARARVGAPSGWPTERSDSVTGLYVWFGANFVFPSWVSCYENVCIAGIDDVVWVIRTDGLRKVAEIPIDVEDPFQALIDLGASEELVKGLLAPENPG